LKVTISTAQLTSEISTTDRATHLKTAQDLLQTIRNQQTLSDETQLTELEALLNEISE